MTTTPIADSKTANIWYAVGIMRRTETLRTRELNDPVDVLAEQFIQRWDKYPRQADNGSYFTVDRPLTNRQLYAHLRGKITLGAYLLDADSRGRFMVLDGDDEPDGRRLRGLAQVLDSLGCPSYFEASRRGGHLWFFLTGAVTGERNPALW